MGKSLAVIMSVYKNDCLDYVRQSVNSILNQTYNDFDFYVQFDGPVSEDIESFFNGLKDKRLIVKKRSYNKGLAFSLNELLDTIIEKRYDYIARMDADDIARLNRFEKQIGFLKNNLQIDVIGGAINEIDENGADKNHIVKYPTTSEDCVKFFAKRNPFAHPAVVFRRSFFEKTKCFYPTEYMRNEDTALWMEGFKNGIKGANLSDVVLDFRITDAMFAQRRNGIVFAKSQLKLRRLINRELKYGFSSYIYAYLMFFLMISPAGVRQLAYRLFR